MRFARDAVVSCAYPLGRWDECLERADAFVTECEAGAAHHLDAEVRQWRASVRYQRVDLESSASDSELALARGREVGDPQILHHVLASNIRIGAELGRLDTVGRLTEVCWEAEARLRAGLRLREAGRSAEAEVQLGRAREFFGSVAATHRPPPSTARIRDAGGANPRLSDTR